MSELTPFQKLLSCGYSVAELAEGLEVTQSCVANWKYRGRIPDHQIPKIRKFLRNKIRVKDLRPDLFK